MAASLLETTSPLAITRQFFSSERHLDGFVGEELVLTADEASLDIHGLREMEEALDEETAECSDEEVELEGVLLAFSAFTGKEERGDEGRTKDCVDCCKSMLAIAAAFPTSAGFGGLGGAGGRGLPWWSGGIPFGGGCKIMDLERGLPAGGGGGGGGGRRRLRA